MAVPTLLCSLLVPSARIGGMPAANSAGTVSRPPPPAMLSTSPAPNPAAARIDMTPIGTVIARYSCLPIRLNGAGPRPIGRLWRLGGKAHRREGEALDPARNEMRLELAAHFFRALARRADQMGAARRQDFDRADADA